MYFVGRVYDERKIAREVKTSKIHSDLFFQTEISFISI